MLIKLVRKNLCFYVFYMAVYERRDRLVKTLQITFVGKYEYVSSYIARHKLRSKVVGVGIDTKGLLIHGRTGAGRTHRVPPLIQKYRFFHKAASPQSIYLSAPCLIMPAYITQTSVKSSVIMVGGYPDDIHPEKQRTLIH